MNISGTWYNELNSAMTIEQNGNELTGTYQTAVGDAEGTYQIYGVINDSADPNQTVAWTVAWVNSYGNSLSTTAWCGQVQTINGVTTITAMWLLTSETSPSNDWASTKIGQDVFTQSQQDEKTVARARAQARGRFSHPV